MNATETRISALRILRARQANPVGDTSDHGLSSSYMRTVACKKREGVWALTDRSTGKTFFVGGEGVDLYDVALEAIRAEGVRRNDEDALCLLALEAYRACVDVYYVEGIAQTEKDLATPEGEARIEAARKTCDTYLEASGYGYEPWESLP